MSWKLGRPIFGRLPAVYRNDNDGDNPSNWLTRYWDEMFVTIKSRVENFYELYLNPATCPEEWLDGMVAPMCGFTEEYYDPTWSLEIKRTLCLNAFGYIWKNRGAGHVLDWMLALHEIPTFPEPHAYYKHDWIRVYDLVRELTQNLILEGTEAENLQTIAQALQIEIRIQENIALIPLTTDSLYRSQLAYAIELYQLPFTIAYDYFYLNHGQIGDPFPTPPQPIVPPRPVTRTFNWENKRRLPGMLRGNPFVAWIRLQPHLERNEREWKLAAQHHDLYTPIYMEGGVCFDYFRLGKSAIGEPLFDLVYERSKALIATFKTPGLTPLFEYLGSVWSFSAIITDLDRQGLHIRFHYPSPDNWKTWREARQLIKLYGAWGGSVGWDYFRLGASRHGHRIWDWLGDIVQPIIDSWEGSTEGLLRTILAAIGSPAELVGRWAFLSLEEGFAGHNWQRLRQLKRRFGLPITPAFDDFRLGASHLGEPLTTLSSIDLLRLLLTQAGRTWEESGRYFMLPTHEDIDTFERLIAETNAFLIMPRYHYFIVGKSRVGHVLSFTAPN